MKKGIASLEGWNKKKNGEMYGKETVSDVPLRWKSAPNHPETHLAYITGEEAALLKQLDLHNSGVRYEDHFGPRGIPSYNGAGAGDSGSSSDQGGGTDGSAGNAGMGDTGEGSGSGGIGGNDGGVGGDGGGGGGLDGVGGISDAFGGMNDVTGGLADAPSANAAEATGPASGLGLGLDAALGNTAAGAFGFSGPTGLSTTTAAPDVSTAMDGLGLGATGMGSLGIGGAMGGFGPGGISGTGPGGQGFGAGMASEASFGDPSGVAAGMLSSVDFSTAFSPAPASAIGLTTSVPGYSMTNYSAQMNTPSQMSVAPGLTTAVGNPVADVVGMMSPAAATALSGMVAANMGVPGLATGAGSITGGYGVEPGQAVAGMLGPSTTSPSTAVASAPSTAAPSSTTATAAPSTGQVSPSTTAPSQVAAAPATPSMLDDPMGFVADKFSQALSNPVSTAVNLGVSAVPGIGLANTVSGLLGGPTVGGMAQSVANAIASGNLGTPSTANVEGYGESTPGSLGYEAAPSQTTSVAQASPSSLGIASLSPVSYDISNFSSPGLAGYSQAALSSPVGYTGPSSISGPSFSLGDITGTYSYTPA